MDKITLLSLSNDLKRIVTSIQRGSFENSERFTQEARRWIKESQDISSDEYLKKLLIKTSVVLSQADSLKKAEDCLMYSVLIQNRALFPTK